MNERSQSFNSSDKHVQVIARPRFDIIRNILVFFLLNRKYLISPLNDNEKSQNLTSCFSVNEARREIIVNCKTSSTRFFCYDHVISL